MAEEGGYRRDVLIICDGASGMSGAVTVASNDLNVLVIEKEPKLRGLDGAALWV
jgi:ribulose 1,5-bisphosphate synthetase/thiazole synthase